MTLILNNDDVKQVLTMKITMEALEINVPLFIKEGDRIRVDTRNCQYVERVKE